MLQLSVTWLMLFVFTLLQHCRIHYHSLLDRMQCYVNCGKCRYLGLIINLHELNSWIAYSYPVLVLHVCVYVCMHACMYVCICVCVCVCTYVCMYVCMHVCMYVCMYVCIIVCMYVLCIFYYYLLTARSITVHR